ncbi:factor arrest protein 10 [Byssothecium circinans]|uniref:Factor arrest protein 10 n=1 Tax=Byssothecium circinans TaxID=147558 RepID=A0A6A5UCG3_9PLEO|nr:factor arrest protein 10 [Byssothecium circinans]
MPRKSAQRSNSSSSLSSQASSSSTISTSSSVNGVGSAPVGDSSTWAARKKRGLWPATKTEPVSAITNTRTQPIAPTASSPSAASAMSALHSPAPMVPSQHNGEQNGAPRAQGQEPQAILHLIPMNGTFERKTITVPYYPEVLKIGRQTNNRTIPSPANGFFDSKVLSRQHAEVWSDRNGKIWIRDVKSSNGTFVNGQRLSPENRDSDPHELREQDMLELGIDIVSEDQKTIVHHKVAARVEHAGIYSNTGNSMMDLNFGEMDASQMSNLGAQNGQQQLAQMRGRTPSQGSMNSQRLQGPGVIGSAGAGMQQPRHPSFWLQPITMEQVVKKLNVEMKAARQQSQDLHQTHSYINAILSADPKKEQSKSSPINHRISPIKEMNVKARFSDPPAPPPQQPLPEKPDAQSSLLRRTDTERPKINGSPVRSDPQLSTLSEALQNAKKEMESQSLRLRDLEELLNEERRAREDAEARANRLERERDAAEPPVANGDVQKPSGNTESEENEAEIIVANGAITDEADADTARLQQKLDVMMSEMNEMKIQMEKYRERAESAEADRKSLAEMIENIRQDNAKKASKDARLRSRSDSEVARDAAKNNGQADEEDELEEGEIMIINEDLEEDGTRTLLRRAVQNGGPVGREDSAEVVAKTSNVLATRPNRNELAIAHGAPAVSILTVVALGVAVMAWLNNYPRVDR